MRLGTIYEFMNDHPPHPATVMTAATESKTDVIDQFFFIIDRFLLFWGKINEITIIQWVGQNDSKRLK